MHATLLVYCGIGKLVMISFTMVLHHHYFLQFPHRLQHSPLQCRLQVCNYDVANTLLLICTFLSTALPTPSPSVGKYHTTMHNFIAIIKLHIYTDVFTFCRFNGR